VNKRKKIKKAVVAVNAVALRWQSFYVIWQSFLKNKSNVLGCEEHKSSHLLFEAFSLRKLLLMLDS